MLTFKNGTWVDDDPNSSLNKIEKRRQRIKKAKPAKKSTEEIYDEINDHKIYGFVLRLTEKLYKEYNIDYVRPVFRNRKISCHSQETLIFGYESIMRSFEYKFCEYITVAHVWAQNDYSIKRERNCYSVSRTENLESVYQLVLHEFAHVLQSEANEYFRGSVHNQYFIEKLNELIILFPYNEVKNI